MRILIVAGIEFPKGRAPARRVATLAQALAAAGADVTVSVPYSSIDSSVDRGSYRIEQAYIAKLGQSLRRGAARIPIWLHLFTRSKWTLGIIWKLVARPPDVFYAYQPWIDSLVAVAVARILGIRVYTEIVDLYPPGLTSTPLIRIAVYLDSLAIATAPRLSSGLLAISSRIEDWARSIRPSLPILRLPILVDVATFSGGDPRGFQGVVRIPGAPVIVYTGSFAKSQGLGILLEAVALLRRSGIIANLIVAGSSGTVDAEVPDELASVLGIDDCFQNLGLVDGDRIPDLQSLATVLVMPKLDLPVNQVGLSTKLGEYLASGRPVIASDVSDVRLYLMNNRDIILCKPGDVDELAEAIQRMISNPCLAKEVGQAGRSMALAHFDSNVNALRVLEFIASC